MSGPVKSLKSIAPVPTATDFLDSAWDLYRLIRRLTSLSRPIKNSEEDSYSHPQEF